MSGQPTSPRERLESQRRRPRSAAFFFGIVRGALCDTSLEALVIDTVNEGCVMETFAAIAAARQAQDCSNPETRRILERIADDEGRHAELGWAIVL